MMGVCFDCLAEIDGVPNRQSCMVTVRPGMRIRRQRGRRRSQYIAMTADLAIADLVVVGAGPAGMAAAVLAGELGLDTVLIDEQDSPGGQIYRAIERAGQEGAQNSPLGADYLAGRPLVEALRASPVHYRPATTVWHIDPGGTDSAGSIPVAGAAAARRSLAAASCWRPGRSSGRSRSRAGPCRA